MKVNRVLARRQIVKMQLETHAGSLFPQHNRAHGFALSVLHFDFGFGGTGLGAQRNNDDGGDEGQAKSFHGQIIEPGNGLPLLRSRAGTFGPCMIHKRVEYTAGKFHIFQGSGHSWH